MIFARVRFVIALVAFMGWLGWLAMAVAQKGKTVVISRAQLTAATQLIVAEVAVGNDGLPNSMATVSETIRGEPIPSGTIIEVLNLRAAMPPGTKGSVTAGSYLLPVIGDGRTYRIAGLPRSPGYEASDPTVPVIYVWDINTKAQLRKLGLMP